MLLLLLNCFGLPRDELWTKACTGQKRIKTHTHTTVCLQLSPLSVNVDPFKERNGFLKKEVHNLYIGAVMFRAVRNE